MTAPSLSAQRPFTRPSCGGTAEHRYTIAAMAWYRCTCGLEFPASAGPTAG